MNLASRSGQTSFLGKKRPPEHHFVIASSPRGAHTGGPIAPFRAFAAAARYEFTTPAAVRSSFFIVFTSARYLPAKGSPPMAGRR